MEVLPHLMARMRLTKATGLEVEKRAGLSPSISSPDERPRPEKGCGSCRGAGAGTEASASQSGVQSCHPPPPSRPPTPLRLCPDSAWNVQWGPVTPALTQFMPERPQLPDSYSEGSVLEEFFSRD